MNIECETFYQGYEYERSEPFFSKDLAGASAWGSIEEANSAYDVLMKKYSWLLKPTRFKVIEESSIVC